MNVTRLKALDGCTQNYIFVCKKFVRPCLRNCNVMDGDCNLDRWNEYLIVPACLAAVIQDIINLNVNVRMYASFFSLLFARTATSHV